MGTGKKETECKIEFTPTAIDDLSKTDQLARRRIFNRLAWIARNHDKIRHIPLKHLPKELSGLKKRREGDWRILYWYYPEKKIIRVYGARHRSTVYQKLR